MFRAQCSVLSAQCSVLSAQGSGVWPIITPQVPEEGSRWAVWFESMMIHRVPRWPRRNKWLCPTLVKTKGPHRRLVTKHLTLSSTTFLCGSRMWGKYSSVG